MQNFYSYRSVIIIQFSASMVSPFFKSIMSFSGKKSLTCSKNIKHRCAFSLLIKKNRCTFSSPAADIFTSFFCHPTEIDDSGPKASCICKREGDKQKDSKDNSSHNQKQYKSKTQLHSYNCQAFAGSFTFPSYHFLHKSMPNYIRKPLNSHIIHKINCIQMQRP